MLLYIKHGGVARRHLFDTLEKQGVGNGDGDLVHKQAEKGDGPFSERVGWSLTMNASKEDIVAVQDWHGDRRDSIRVFF